MATTSLAQSENPSSAPTEGDVVLADQPYTVKWTPTSSGPVFIQLSYDDNVIATNLTVSTKNTGSFVWKPVDVFAGSHDYFLVICDLILGQSSCSYTVGRFHIALAATSSSSSSSSLATSTTASASSSVPTAKSTTPTTTSTGQSTTSSAPVPTSTTDPDSTTGLATGSIIAISVAITVIALALIACAFWYKKKRRNQRAFLSRAAASKQGSDVYGVRSKAELAAEDRPDYGWARIPVELQTERGPYELGAHQSR
ncbi:hypothetical protein BJ170DRAFT_593146 [Xylariales sp. AK1849]|nr:hypothetical protein BJ170DRAFT_593146 [Xylariales sp. AK1849]